MRSIIRTRWGYPNQPRLTPASSIGADARSTQPKSRLGWLGRRRGWLGKRPEFGVAALVLVLSACGGDDKRVVAPAKDAGAGTPVVTQAGGQVGVVDNTGGSGLSGAARSRYEEGWQAWLNGDLPTAKKKFQEAQSLDSKSPAPPYSLGAVLGRLGDVAGAKQSYRSAFSANPDHEVSMCAYALLLASAGHAGEADTFLTD